MDKAWTKEAFEEEFVVHHRLSHFLSVTHVPTGTNGSLQFNPTTGLFDQFETSCETLKKATANQIAQALVKMLDYTKCDQHPEGCPKDE